MPHFRADALRRVGGWDAWNVAEDADLGLRLARFGVRVATLDSDTFEEAPATFGHWLGQRRRWQKGWLQTAIVHSRRPARLLRELGLARAASAQALIGGAVFGAMFGPWLAIDALWRAAFGDLLAPRTPLHAIASILTVTVFLAGLPALLLPAIRGLRGRRLDRFTWTLALLPLYYCLVSVAAWLALLDFGIRPFHWVKTEHGIQRDASPDSSPALSAASPDD